MGGKKLKVAVGLEKKTEREKTALRIWSILDSRFGNLGKEKGKGKASGL